MIDVAFANLWLLVSVLLTRFLKNLANTVFVFIHNAMTNILNFVMKKANVSNGFEGP